MNIQGVWVWVASAGCLLLGCSSSSSDNKSTGPVCATSSLTMPMDFSVSNVTPANGASVPNSAITESFELGEPLQVDIQEVDTAAHTAGMPTSAISWLLSPITGGGVKYTSNAITWANPGKVEVNFAGLYQDPSTGCYYSFPNPMFSYDVTAP